MGQGIAELKHLQRLGRSLVKCWDGFWQGQTNARANCVLPHKEWHAAVTFWSKTLCIREGPKLRPVICLSYSDPSGVQIKWAKFLPSVSPICSQRLGYPSNNNT